MIGIWVWRALGCSAVGTGLLCFSPDDRDLGLARWIDAVAIRLIEIVSVPMIGIWVWRE